MKLFGRKDDKNVVKAKVEKKVDSEERLNVKILGSGCTNCNKLEAEAIKALGEMKVDHNLEHITDFAQIASYGVMKTPALVVNNKVLISGYVAKKDEIKEKIESLTK